MRNPIAWLWLGAAWLAPSLAWPISLIVDPLDTPQVVQAGESVSFSFAFAFDPGESILATQAEISAPHLTGFRFPSASGITGPNPWDLTSTFRRIGPDADGNLFNPMWVHAEDVYGEDAPAITWDEVDGIAPLGTFTAIATYNGEIEFHLSRWVLDSFDRMGPHGAEYTLIPLDPAWAHIRTGITIVGGADLPPQPTPPDAPPPVPPPLPPPASGSDPVPAGYPQGPDYSEFPEPPSAALAWLGMLLVLARRAFR